MPPRQLESAHRAEVSALTTRRTERRELNNTTGMKTHAGSICSELRRQAVGSPAFMHVYALNDTGKGHFWKTVETPNGSTLTSFGSTGRLHTPLPRAADR